MPSYSVRGRIRRFIERHADKLGDNVLEVGSRLHDPRATWLNNRDLARGMWTGIDMQPGLNVDQVADIHALPFLDKTFSGVLCSEVLEHVKRPWVALPELRRVIRPGGWVVITTLTSFPIHGFPDDYYRYTASGLKLLMEDAGFKNVDTYNDGELEIKINDHGEAGFCTRKLPIHVFGVGQC